MANLSVDELIDMLETDNPQDNQTKAAQDVVKITSAYANSTPNTQDRANITFGKINDVIKQYDETCNSSASPDEAKKQFLCDKADAISESLNDFVMYNYKREEIKTDQERSQLPEDDKPYADEIIKFDDRDEKSQLNAYNTPNSVETLRELKNMFDEIDSDKLNEALKALNSPENALIARIKEGEEEDTIDRITEERSYMNI